MDPNGSKDNMFNSWTKTLIATYIDLFVRLAAIFFVLFIVTELLARGTYGGGGYSGTNHYGIIGWIIITLGLLNFARQAPKFVSDMLGIKGLGGFRLFGGLTDFRATASMAIAPVTGAVAGAVAGKNVGGKIWGGISGFFGGGANAAHSYFENGDKPLDWHRIDAARMRYNDQRYVMANDGTTFLDRMKARGQRLAGLQTDKQKNDELNAIYEKDSSLNSQMIDWLKNDKDDTFGLSAKAIRVFGGNTKITVGNAAHNYELDINKKYSIYDFEEIKRTLKSQGVQDEELVDLDKIIKAQQNARIHQCATNPDANKPNELVFQAIIHNRVQHLSKNSNIDAYKIYAELDDGKIGTQYTDSHGVTIDATFGKLKGTGSVSENRSKLNKVSHDSEVAKAAHDRVFHEENNRH